MSSIDDLLGLTFKERSDPLFKPAWQTAIGQTEFSQAGISSIRKRALAKQLDRLDLHAASYQKALDEGRRGLSSSQYFATQNEFENVRAAQLRLRSLQKEAERLEDAERAKLSFRQSQPSLRPSGFKFSAAAIAGIIERQRRQNAPMSRELFSRAQAKAAARRRYDLAQAYKKSGHTYASFFSLHGVDITDNEVDPCIEYRAKQKARREVMFALKMNRGYRTSHRRNPC